MDTLVPYAIMLVVGIVGLSLLVMLIFGIRSLLHGKVSYLTMGMVAIPFLIWGALGAASGDWAEAAILTVLVMIALGMLALVLSGVRGLFS